LDNHLKVDICSFFIQMQLDHGHAYRRPNRLLTQFSLYICYVNSLKYNGPMQSLFFTKIDD
jgi:hypothetical protein